MYNTSCTDSQTHADFLSITYKQKYCYQKLLQYKIKSVKRGKKKEEKNIYFLIELTLNSTK